ncbi:hypothetical protein [Streptomyces sp. NRRL WC-3549]|uniref:hypothetical protein n=1 Tax=Streptomyces sp. NRRL WC-3549 TaxID=1463925 RepID=UPI0004C6D0F6|nr:hypothetical protein [Streptomyces sp. NRRL WC-3549]
MATLADVTDPNPPGLAPNDFPATAGPGPVASSTGRVRLSMTRWLLTPRTMWHARRLAAAAPGMDAQTAWVVARLTRHPDEYAYALAHPGSYAHALAHLDDRRT